MMMIIKPQIPIYVFFFRPAVATPQWTSWIIPHKSRDRPIGPLFSWFIYFLFLCAVCVCHQAQISQKKFRFELCV